MTNITHIKEEVVLQSLKDNKGDYERVAKDLGIPAEIIRQIDITINNKFNRTPEGNGAKHLKKYLVGKTPVGVPWDNENPKIAKARKAYDEGKVEICTGRDGLNLLLYAIPRRNRSMKGRPYFSKMEQE